MTGSPRRDVVAAAIFRDGCLLAARRSDPPDLAGRWELPGGKVEPGEDLTDALRREIREELGVEVVLGAQLRGAWPLGDRYLLRVWVAELADPQAVPLPLEQHDELRWVTPAQSSGLGWLPGDRAPVDLAWTQIRL